MNSRCAALALVVVFASACHSATDPVEDVCYSPPPDGAYASGLHRVVGSGQCDSGVASVTPFAADGNFAAILRFQVHRAKPRTTYIVQRAAEYDGAPVSSDGVCQRAEGNWAPFDGSTIPSFFLAFPLGGSTWSPPPGPLGLMTLVTDADGSGTTEFEYHTGPVLPRGRKFDVQMRLVDDDTAPTSDLRSGCMTVTVQ